MMLIRKKVIVVAKRRKIIHRKSYRYRNKSVPQWMLVTMLIIAAMGILFGFFRQGGAETTQLTAAENTETMTTPEFISSIAETARQVAKANDLYASVMIAQAILESSNGQSALSQAPYYNYFGIKGDYNGQSVTLPTLEDDGTGTTYTIDAQFRAYGSQLESLQDYANLLQGELYLGVRRSNTTSYQEATAALTGTYATDTSYNVKLNHLIEEYGLTIYDN